MAARAFIKMSQICGSRNLTWLLLVNIATAMALWVAMLVMHFAHADNRLLYTLLALPSEAYAFATHPWTLASYMFVHFSPLHLLFNMLWLFWFGRMLADLERDRRITWLFLAGGMAGGVAYIASSILTGYGPGNYLTGSSAAVLCMMCYAAMRMPNRTIGLFLIGEVKLKWVTLVCVLLTLLAGSVAIPTQCAHVGGIVAGLSFKWIARTLHGSKSKAMQVRTSRRVRNAMPTQQELNDRLDILLDKIRISGFDSLTDREKSELNYLSTLIKKQ